MIRQADRDRRERLRQSVLMDDWQHVPQPPGEPLPEALTASVRVDARPRQQAFRLLGIKRP
jgi:hypothetical protein